jgi:hypothetical protein
MRKTDEKKNGEHKSRGGKGKAMFFLLRVAFWLCVVLVLLPSGKSEDTTQTSKVSPAEAVSAASAAISDLRHFCERQPEACAVGGQAAVSLGHRAKDGAKMIYDFLTEKLASHETGSIARGTAGKQAPALPAKASQQTLTPADLEPAWRAPQGTRT